MSEHLNPFKWKIRMHSFTILDQLSKLTEFYFAYQHQNKHEKELGLDLSC